MQSKQICHMLTKAKAEYVFFSVLPVDGKLIYTKRYYFFAGYVSREFV